MKPKLKVAHILIVVPNKFEIVRPYGVSVRSILMGVKLDFLWSFLSEYEPFTGICVIEKRLEYYMSNIVLPMTNVRTFIIM